jgi:hypothetical protein
VKNWSSIVYGPNANPEFEAIIATDGQEFKVGKITIRAAYAGTYNGSTTYLLIDENGKSMQFFLVTPSFIDVGDQIWLKKPLR